jgi:purine-binding chemotaxis protein CheW
MSPNQRDVVLRDAASQWATFRRKDQRYGNDVVQCQEVLRIAKTSAVSGVPNCVLGVIYRRGELVNAIDTKTRFNLPTIEVDDVSHIFVIDAFGKSGGLLADNVLDLAHVSDSQIESALTHEADDDNSFLRGRRTAGVNRASCSM